MKRKNDCGGILLFLAGVLTASVIQFIYPPPREALADQYSCIRTDLDAQGMTGNIPDPEFTITYDVPSCYRSKGYKVQRVYMYGDQVAVHYQTTGGVSVNSFPGGMPKFTGGASQGSPHPIP